MLCIKPFRRPGLEHGCGQCLPCRVNRRRMWTGRIILESLCHPASAFVTLTYSPQFEPAGGNLDDSHWRQFTKEIGVRYFGVGEYGEHSLRPHYHVIVFGVEAAEAERLASDRWPYGFVSSLPFSPETASYVAGYTLKKLKSKVSDLGLLPEFARMSRRPAIGAPALALVSSWLHSAQGAKYLADVRDVPRVIRCGGKLYPLGTTLVRKLRASVDVDAQDEVLVRGREFKRKCVIAAEQLYPDLVKKKEVRRVVAYERLKHNSRVLRTKI